VTIPPHLLTFLAEEAGDDPDDASERLLRLHVSEPGVDPGRSELADVCAQGHEPRKGRAGLVERCRV
jgi:hypothetical protein